MIKKKLRVKFDNSLRLRETRDAREYKFPFTVVDSSLIGKPEERYYTKNHIIKTSIDRTLASMWNLFDNLIDLEKVLYEYSKRYVKDKLKEGTLRNIEKLELSTSNYPNECPFDPSRIAESGQRSFEIEVKVKENT